MALHKGRFILLVERGATLPSNLQGLYEVRCEGDKLEYDATMKLLEAFNDFQKVRVLLRSRFTFGNALAVREQR